MQLTPYTDWTGIPIVWNWPNNVTQGISKFNGVDHSTTAYRDLILTTNTYAGMIATINRNRAAQRPPLPALTVTIPPWTTGGYDTNLLQVQLNQIRGYNGFGGRDVFGLRLREFRLQMDANNLPVLVINVQNNTATAVWERVPVAARPPFGDPNYVNNVLGQRPLNGGTGCN